ncbi:hypothetical protein PDG61_08735 [Mycolicibacterium sp. BiH015]|uniref:hypothetical protein n=1 Tax=Mycolicibacterium sp. BiH015 TaxID=3018808 RepID=UPI0022DF1D22|nr:hypothetical protein [Mycolicibacterium sp. BiH015]MDA2890994.1 hypothetical protein [Mycolicibacterium sp. BiH015]
MREAKMLTSTASQLLWPALPLGAQDLGYNDQGGVLVNTSADGLDLQVIWREIQEALAVWNRERGALTDLLSFWTTDTASAVPQAIQEASFEQATEYGIPESHRAPTSHIVLGYEFGDFDFRVSTTWKFLRDSSAEQIRAQIDMAFAADSKLVQGSILQRLFDNTPTVNEWGHNVWSLFNGDDMVPPAYLGKKFTAPHNHYLVSGAAELDSADVELLIREVQHHGFGMTPNSQLILLCNPKEAEIISTFRAGRENNNNAIAKHDYIPSQGQPAYLQPDNIVGQVAPATFNKLRVNGSYGPVFVVQSDFVPEDYVSVFATSGPGSKENVIGVRQHPQRQYQNLRQIPGLVNDYPLQDSYFQRSFGTGTRRRGGAAVMQVKTPGEYEVPVVPR